MCNLLFLIIKYAKVIQLLIVPKSCAKTVLPFAPNVCFLRVTQNGQINYALPLHRGQTSTPAIEMEQNYRRRQVTRHQVQYMAPHLFSPHTVRYNYNKSIFNNHAYTDDAARFSRTSDGNNNATRTDTRDTQTYMTSPGPMYFVGEGGIILEEATSQRGKYGLI